MSRRRDTERAAEYVSARRGELGLTQAALAATADGLDVKTIYNLESGSRWPQAKTRNAIEKALGWQPGDLQKVAEGVEPTPPLRHKSSRDDTSANATSAGQSAGVRIRAVAGDVDVEARAPSVQRWFVAELERRDLRLIDVAAPLDVLRTIADHNDQTLGELLTESGLASSDELAVRAAESDPSLDAFLEEAERIKASPHLSKSQKKDLEIKIQEILKTRGKSSGDA